MKTVLICLVTVFSIASVDGQSSDYGLEYIEKWKQFYPSGALAEGMHTAIFTFEDFSADRVADWLDFNRDILRILSDTQSQYYRENRIDARLLRVQARSEIDRWEKPATLSRLAQLIDGAVDPVLKARYLDATEKNRLICNRLLSVQKLCEAAMSLSGDNRNTLESGLKSLENSASYYEQRLPEIVSNPACENFPEQCRQTAGRIRDLINHIRTELLPKAREVAPVLGRTEFARQLALYTDSDLTPEKLAEMALQEIRTAKTLMNQVSLDYLRKQYPGQPIPETDEKRVRMALDDMEKDAPTDGEDYLKFWLELHDAAIRFIEEHQIATLPEFPTLRIMAAPESAGPAARIGWVESAPPFAPNPVTTLYLPSIPETFPDQERKEFWASFNKPFNRMIVIHELLPGHYMQLKISSESPHPVRLLFPYGIYIEGWATFCERVLLDADWENENPLTFLAHLRKRLENANRAYTSVQVHCNGWNQDQVMQFSVGTSLLAPQFAKSLWGRIMGAPLQLTSYFLGGQQFTDLLAAEKKRLGDRFVLRDFMDVILRAGPAPIDELPFILKATTPGQ